MDEALLEVAEGFLFILIKFGVSVAILLQSKQTLLFSTVACYLREVVYVIINKNVPTLSSTYVLFKRL